MKTSLFSGKTVAFMCYSVVLVTTTTGFYCFKQFYLNHLRIITSLNPVFESSDSLEFIQAGISEESVSPVSVTENDNTPSITPPLPGMDPVSKNIYLHTNAGVTFVSINKTQITVPPFAFADEEGNVIDAEVEMQFREFLRPYDIFRSGISMRYDSTSTLSTVCLFELNASSFGRKVYINPANPIQVMLPQRSENVNLWHLNPLTNTWNPENRPQPIVRKASDDNVRLSRSLILPKYAIAVRCKTKMKLKRERFLGKKQAPDHFIFTFMNFTDQFPEFKELINTNWVYDSDDALMNYYRIFSPGQEDVYAEEVIYCDSASLEKSGEDYILKLTGQKRNARIIIKPYIVNATDELNAGLAYEAYLSARENRFATESQLLSVFNTIENNSLNETDEILSPSGPVKFSIDKFGIWNAGKPESNDTGAFVHATFIDEAGRTIDVRKGWMIKKNINALFSETNFNRLAYSNTSRTFFWTILPENKIGIVFPEEFKRKPVNGNMKLKMKIYEDPDVLKVMSYKL